MGLLGNLICAAIDTATLPLRVAADIATLPESAMDPSKGPFDHTAKGLKDLKDDLL